MRQGSGRRAATALLTVAVSIGLTGCSFPTFSDFSLALDVPSVSEGLDSLATGGTAQLSSPTIRQERYLTVGIDTSANTAPLYMEDSSGKVSGIDVDLASALADELGLKVRFVSVGDVDSATASTVDIVMGVPSEDLSGSTVVGSYAESASAFFYKGSTGVVSSSDLNGKTVGVQSGSVSEQKLNKTTLGMSRQTFEDLNDAFEALESGSIDYVLCDAYAGAYVASSYDDIGFAGSLNDPSSYGIAIAASNTALKQSVQQALENVEGNGVYDAIRTRWVGSLPTLTSSQQISDISTADADSSSTDSDLSDASEDISTETSEVDNAKDGSTAGSNAVIL